MKPLSALPSKILPETSLSLLQAIEAVKTKPNLKFNESIEIIIQLNIDPQKTEQLIKGACNLPSGLGTKKIIVAIVDPLKQKEATAAGADFVGGEELIEKIEKELWFAYDVIVTTPPMMAKLGKIGKLLGPKKLMPTIKDGTVTNNVMATINEIKHGKFFFRTQKTGIISGAIGKIDFSTENLAENFNAVVTAINAQKPTAVKKTLIKTLFIKSTMGKAFKVINDKNKL